MGSEYTKHGSRLFYSFFIHNFILINILLSYNLYTNIILLKNETFSITNALNVTPASNESVLFLTRVTKAGSTSVHGWLQV